jgi:hypothetical protein
MVNILLSTKQTQLYFSAYHCSADSMLQTLDSNGCVRSRRTDSIAEVTCGRRSIEIVISKGLITASSNYIT